MKKLFPFLLLFLSVFPYPETNAQIKGTVPQSTMIAPCPVHISLNGECAFAADYADAGDKFEWFSPSLNDDVWDRVKIPHVWSLDSRYPFFEGAAWYRRAFTVPIELKNKHIRLVFEAVYSKSVVWLNGKQIATHEGGYTPFEVDVTSSINFDKSNLLVVKADNRSKRKPNVIPQLVRAWMEDVGIIRDVYLEAGSDVYMSNQMINAVPNLQTGDATINISSWIRNPRNEPVKLNLQGIISMENEPLKMNNPKLKVEIPANSTKRVEMMVNLPKEMVRLWGLDTPVLYNLATSIEGLETSRPVSFGIRKFEVRGTELLLNGFPIRLAGANRVASGVVFGQDDPLEFVEKDLRLMKEAGLEFMRMHHVPLSKAVLDWADRNGMLLIEECATPSDLFSEEASALDKKNIKEMVERDWNRPSVVAWSIGNEYESETPEGMKWSKEMKEFVLSIDPNRLICFASNRAAKLNLKPEEEATSLMDFVCLNTYGSTPDDNAANIDRAHLRWPDKPFIITEYGYRADRVGQEQDRELWFSEMIKIFRDRPFISGASLWSFNDYRSRYVSTNPDGFRWWGLVDAKRNIRGSYSLFRREFTPVELKEARILDKQLVIKLAGRVDFPVYPPTGYQLKLEFYNFRGRQIEVQNHSIDLIAPGSERILNIPMKEGIAYFRGEILRGRFSMLIFGPTTWSKQK